MAMAAVFGAASRATFTFIVFAFEITHDYNAILPLMLALRDRRHDRLHYLPSSIMTEKLARRGLNVPEEYDAGALRVVRVGEVMRTDVQPIRADMTVAELTEGMNGHAAGHATGKSTRPFSVTEGLPIVGADASLKGIVTQGDLLRALENDPEGKITVLEAGSDHRWLPIPMSWRRLLCIACCKTISAACRWSAGKILRSWSGILTARAFWVFGLVKSRKSTDANTAGFGHGEPGTYGKPRNNAR